MNNYFYINDINQNNFITLPLSLVITKKYKKLSSDSKLFYGLLIRRQYLSLKNNWFDEKNRVYLIFSIEEIIEVIGVGKNTAIKMLKELEDFGLIEKKRRGQGLPSLIYLKKVDFILKGSEI